MPSVTFSVPDKVKSEMREFPWMNWSELVREEALKQEERAKLFEELDELTKNSTLTDKDCEEFARRVKKRLRKELS